MSRNLSVGSSYDGKVINTMLHKLDMRYVVTMIYQAGIRSTLTRKMLEKCLWTLIQVY